MRTTYRRLAVPATVFVTACVAGTISLSADEWMLPEPASFHVRGMQFVAEIFPPGARQNQDKRALC
jgi:hypothetical protein